MTREEAVEFLRNHDDFVLTSHESADADGIGAEYALAKALHASGKRAIVANSEPVSPKFAFIDRDGIVSSLDLAEIPAKPAVVVLDTVDLDYTGRAADELVPRAAALLLIDHHDTFGEAPADAYVESDASSTCEMAWRLIRLLGVDPGLDAREAIYAGIVYDTGSFSYPKTSPATLALAAELAAEGVVPNVVYRSLYESGSLGALLLRKLALASLEVLADGKIAVQTLRVTDLERSGARYEESEELINAPMQCERVEVSVMFKEAPGGPPRCSLRSKGAVDVARVAQAFGGGGHRTAAGFRCARTLEESRERVLESLVKALGS